MIEYSIEIVDKVLDEIEIGKSVSEICRQDGMPSERSFYNWLAKDRDNLLQRYAHARKCQSEVIAQELVDMARSCGLTAGEINRMRLIIDTMKWAASKLKPDRWGDNSTLTHSGTVQIEQLVINRTPRTIEHQAALPVIDIKPDDK